MPGILMGGLFAAASALALAILLRPWWSGHLPAVLRRRSANVRAYESRLRELGDDVAAGILQPEVLGSAQQELAQRLLREAQDEPAAAPVTSSRALALAIGLLLPAFAAGWYYLGGSWRMQAQIARSAEDPEYARTHAVEAMVARLAARLQENPDDAEGWSMLGRSYAVMERYADAAQAYARASALAQDQDPELLVNQGEALALARDRDLQGRPTQLFQMALEVSPDSGRALWYAGLSAAQAQDYPAALRHWRRLLGLELPEELRANLEQRVAELEKLAGERPVAVEAPASLRLRVKVALSPQLAGQVTPDQTLFVFAKAAQGPPMPLAVQRLPASKLPLELTLDDSQAMMPDLKLSKFDRWIVTARLTRSGSPQAQAGDLQGSRTVGRGEAGKAVEILIQDVVP